MSFSEVYLDLMAFKFSKVRSNISVCILFLVHKNRLLLNEPAPIY